MTEHFNDKGDFRYVNSETRKQIEIRTTCEFHVQLNSELIGPNSATDRRFTIILDLEDELDVFCPERYTIIVKELPHRGEIHDGESLVEVLEPHEMSLYDRLRHEMLQEVSKIAHRNDLDSYEDDGDLGWDEDDGDIPLTPHEYVEMQQEFLRDNPPEKTTDKPVEESAVNAEDSDSSDAIDHAS